MALNNNYDDINNNSSCAPHTPARPLQVLEELEDIIDLPSRAAMVADMLNDNNLLLRAFEGLIVLEGTSNNAKQAWIRCGAAGRDNCDYTCIAWWTANVSLGLYLVVELGVQACNFIVFA